MNASGPGCRRGSLPERVLPFATRTPAPLAGQFARHPAARRGHLQRQRRGPTPAQGNALGITSHHHHKPCRGGPFVPPASVIICPSAPRLVRPCRAGDSLRGRSPGALPQAVHRSPRWGLASATVIHGAGDRMVADCICVFSANGALQHQPRATPWVPRRIIITSPVGAGHSRQSHTYRSSYST